jgi:pSer/pThr/pTyr-binding forkhead associated (FHA) protein
MPSLVFVAGPIAGRRYKLAHGEYVIGRRSDCQIFVPDMRVSRQHARLWRTAERWSVEDLGSNNGTFVNGNKLERPTELAHDDEIVIANNRIRVEAQDDTAETRAVAQEGNVTIVDVGASSVIKSREDSNSGRFPAAVTSCAACSQTSRVTSVQRRAIAPTT